VAAQKDPARHELALTVGKKGTSRRGGASRSGGSRCRTSSSCGRTIGFADSRQGGGSCELGGGDGALESFGVHPPMSSDVEKLYNPSELPPRALLGGCRSILTPQALTAILFRVRHFWKQPRGIWNPGPASPRSRGRGTRNANAQPGRAASVFGVWRSHLLAPAKRACSAARCYLSASSGALVAGPMADLAPDAVRLRPLTVTLLAARSAMDSLS